MFAVISPAKTLDFDTPLAPYSTSIPTLLDQAQHLVPVCQSLTRDDLMQLMKISQPLADLNVQRFQEWSAQPSKQQGRHALFAFKGDVYIGLQAETLSSTAINYAQNHLAMLSGLYGLLRPLDVIMPYRLEMGTRLQGPWGKDLYQFWQHQITAQLNKFCAEIGSGVLINLASEEYFKAVKPQNLNAKIVNVVFLDEKLGQYKIISFYAKRARGLMARFIIERQIQNVNDLKAFNSDGYYFDDVNSSSFELVFKRDEVR